MKKLLTLTFILALSLIFEFVKAQGYHVRIGTIGNSITEGTGLSSPTTQAYPIQLGGLLEEIFGDTCIVKNFGLTTTTMLKNGDVPYWDTQQLKDYLAYAPEICFIMLGTNDTKPKNWDIYGDEYIGDYLSLIDTIRLRNPSTLFMLAYPPPAFEFKYEIRDEIIVNGIIPGIDSVLKVVDAELVDFYNPLLDSAHLFPDAIHPGVEGAGIMAQMILDKMIETDIIHKADTGLTFITSFKTTKTPLPLNDSSELSWTTINADSVFLNGVLVDASGSIKISPPETTKYTLLAKGDKSNDTIELLQEVYSPVLTRLRIYPATITRAEDDTIYFNVFYYDQYDTYILNEYFAVQWDIINGSGYLYGATDTSVYYVAEQPDTIQLEVSYDDLSSVATIYTKAVTSAVNNIRINNELITFPNPCSKVVHFKLSDIHGNIAVKIFDLKGVLIAQKNIIAKKSDKAIYSITISDLPEGNYIINLEYSGKLYSNRISILKE